MLPGHFLHRFQREYELVLIWLIIWLIIDELFSISSPVSNSGLISAGYSHKWPFLITFQFRTKSEILPRKTAAVTSPSKFLISSERFSESFLNHLPLQYYQMTEGQEEQHPERFRSYYHWISVWKMQQFDPIQTRWGLLFFDINIFKMITWYRFI